METTCLVCPSPLSGSYPCLTERRVSDPKVVGQNLGLRGGSRSLLKNALYPCSKRINCWLLASTSYVRQEHGQNDYRPGCYRTEIQLNRLDNQQARNQINLRNQDWSHFLTILISLFLCDFCQQCTHVLCIWFWRNVHTRCYFVLNININ